MLNGVKNCIPKTVKDAWKSRNNIVIQYGLLKINSKWKFISDIKTKDIYRELYKHKVTKPTAIETLEKKLNIQIDKELWQSFFRRKGLYTKNRFFRIWQFKILHGLHNNQRNLKKWNISTSDKCELCLENKIDDDNHYFLECPFNDNLLKNLHNTISNILETNINLSDIEYITGIWIGDTQNKTILVIDKVLFFGRMYLIKSKKNKKEAN